MLQFYICFISLFYFILLFCPCFNPLAPRTFYVFEWFFYIHTIQTILWLRIWGCHRKWYYPKTLKARVFWLRHYEVVILVCWAKIMAQVYGLYAIFGKGTVNFIFSGCLINIIKHDGSEESTFSKTRVRWCTLFANLACSSWNWKNGPSESKLLWDSTIDEFLDLLQHILEFTTTGNCNKREISVVGRSGCGLSINMKKVGEGTNPVKNSGYFPACNAVIMLKMEARPGCTRTKGCSSALQTTKNQKRHF